MHRREFLSTVAGAAMVHAGAFASAFQGGAPGVPMVLSALAAGPLDLAETRSAVKPMALGTIIHPTYSAPETAIARVKELGMSNCFLGLDDWIGRFNAADARRLSALLEKYGITATCVEIVGPGRLIWDSFLDGPSTIGLVPVVTRAARVDALKQASDFAKRLGVHQVQTLCGFLPESPGDPLYQEAVLAIRDVAVHCAANGQDFLMETGLETPTTLSRAILDINQPNLGVGLDTANLITYGKANPVDAIEIIGRHVRSVHAKDGMWPVNPMHPGREVLIGTGRADFLQVFTKLEKLGYTGAITIEREATSGPQQMEDIKHEKVYLERILAQVRDNQS
jgi:L-ribulose-5-phosphate 3-epimerase